MRTALICTAPPSSFVTLADAKAQLRVTTDTDDNLITAMLASACGALDGPDGFLKRAVGDQALQLVLSRFDAGRRCLPRGAILLPLPPVKAVSNVKYVDLAGVEQTLDAGAYRLVNCGTDPSYLLPTSSWPAHDCRPDAVTITFTAGYGDNVPMPIKQAVILMVKQQYDLGQRNAFLASSAVTGVGERTYFAEGAGNLLDQAAQNLLYNYRLLQL